VALPPISGQPIPAARPIADPRAAAQRAFFQAALGKAQGAQAAAPTAQLATAAPQAARIQTAAPVASQRAPTTAQPPDRSARPGSLLNITV
jgi:hypothetical protein